MKSLRLFIPAIAVIAGGATPQVAFAAETVEVEAILTCSSGQVITKSVFCSPGQTVVAEAQCADGTTAVAEAVCPVREASAFRLADHFRMGLRLSLGGGGGIGRTDEKSDGAYTAAIGHLVLQAPTVFGQWGGLELSGGTGISGFPGLKDVLSTNTFEGGMIFHFGSRVDMSVGYRFTNLSDIDESLGQIHSGRLGLAYKVTQRFEVGISGHLGSATFVRKAAFSEENSAGTLEFERTWHTQTMTGGAEFSATLWFW